VLHRQQDAANVDVAHLMVMLDRLLGRKRAELALEARVVERYVQSAEGADCLFDERDDIILPCDVSLHKQAVSTG
jgi:hypothetical protein